MIQDLKASGSGSAHTLASSATGPASYMGPSPPAETPAHPHHCVEILYEQPAGFSGKNVPARMGFNLATFATSAGLGAPIAANYFTVTG